MKNLNSYGDREIAKIMVETILEELELSLEDEDIFVLRHAFGWYHEDIGYYVGNKYRGKPYTEGTIRYRLRKMESQVEQYKDN